MPFVRTKAKARGAFAKFKLNAIKGQGHAKPERFRICLFERPVSAKQHWLFCVGRFGNCRQLGRSKNGTGHVLQFRKMTCWCNVHSAVEIACDDACYQVPRVRDIEAQPLNTATLTGNLRSTVR